MSKPFIAISAGDPAGIGPEICVKALNEQEVYTFCSPFVVCDVQVIKRAIDLCNLSLKIISIAEPAEGVYSHGCINVMDIHNIDMERLQYGKVSEMTGKASFEYVTKVIELALTGKADATVTGPINKEAIRKAGYHFSGHTEIFAHYTGTKNYAMMLAEKTFRVIHVSTHVSMLEAVSRIRRESVLNSIKLADEGLKRMGIKNPKIAVNGINPHAGENGLFGKEEIEHIIPAIEQAVKMGIDADGPHPPDTIFPKMLGGQYDIVVCMYHDQGHIPTKLLGFRYDHEQNTWVGMSGVNITLGLPVIRVSVDHGTAFDKAGKGTSNPESMQQAISYAAKLAATK